MKNRSKEVEVAIQNLPIALNAAGWNQTLSDKTFRVNYQPIPHQYPRGLEASFAAIYGFHDEEGWLKIGKAGPGSDNRYRYQHYHPQSAPSTLAATLKSAGWFSAVSVSAREEILARTGRLSILVHRSLGEAFLGFLESFFILRLTPRFEGHRWK